MNWRETCSVVNNILRVAFPIAISGIVFSSAALVSMNFLGNINKYNLYLLAAFSPIYYLLIAVQESMRATAIIVSSKKEEDIAISEIITNFIYIIMLVSLIFIMSIYFSTGFIANKLHIVASQRISFIFLCREMAALNFIVCCNVVINAVIYGSGYAGLALLFNIISCLGNMILLAIFCRYFSFNLDGFAYSTDISYGIVCLMMLFFLKTRNGLDNWSSVLSYRQCVALLSGIRCVGVPVFFSYLIIFGMLFIFNSILSQYGVAIVAGYGLAYRMQVLIILPAISLGSALAVLVNRQLIMKYQAILIGVGLALCLYCVLSIVMYEYRNLLVNWMAKDILIKESVLSYMSYVVPSYFVLGPVLVFITFLEQIGYGAQVFFYNIIYFLCVGLAGYHIVASHSDYITFYKMISAANTLPLIFIPIFISSLIKKLN